jgi:hypothetical protein
MRRIILWGFTLTMVGLAVATGSQSAFTIFALLGLAAFAVVASSMQGGR